MIMWRWHPPYIFPDFTSFAVWKSPSFPLLSVVIHNDGYFYNPFKSSYQSTDFLWCYAVQSGVAWQTYFCGIDHLCYFVFFFKMEKNRSRMREKEEEEGLVTGLMTMEILHLGIQVHQLAMMLPEAKLVLIPGLKLLSRSPSRTIRCSWPSPRLTTQFNK